MNKLLYILLAACCIFSCRPVKKVERITKAINEKDTAQTIVITPEVKKVDSFAIVKNIISDLERNRITFKTFYAKVKIDYQGKESGDQATAYIHIQKDSLIWVSLVGALGIEGVRLLITKDSVKVMNKLKKTVEFRSSNYLQELIDVPVDFFGMQDAIIGNPVFIDSNIVYYKAQENELLVMMAGNIFRHLISLENSNLRIVHSKLDYADPMRNITCDITYNGYQKIGNRNFSAERKITISEKSKLDVDLEFKQVNFDQPIDFPFNIPKNYKRK